MIDTLRRRPMLAALAVLAAALAVLLALEVGESSRTQIPATASKPAAPPDAKLLPPTQRVAAEQAYPETVTRPLFIPTRRPAPAQAVAAAPAFVRGQFQLLGVTIAGNTKIAMLREKSSGKIHRVPLGGDVNGIKVSTIERDTVTLAQGGETESVPMQVQKLAAAGAPAPAANHTAGGGPFGGAAPPPGTPGAPPPPGTPGAPPAPAPATTQVAPIPAASAALLGIAPPTPPNPQANQPPPAPPATAGQPMTPEELLARRRARRAQTTQ